MEQEQLTLQLELKPESFDSLSHYQGEKATMNKAQLFFLYL